jgi:hypothetical protein
VAAIIALHMDDLQEAAFSALSLMGKTGYTIDAKYRKYASLKAVMERSGNRLFLRVSPGFSAGGRDVLVGLVLDLTRRIFKMNALDNAYVRAYHAFRNGPASNELNKSLKHLHGRKRKLNPLGKWHDLNDVVLRLVREYPLLSELAVPKIGWNEKGGGRVLGFYDEAEREVLISKQLDQKRVPFFVLEYVVFHELLHAKHPSKHGRQRRTVHTSVFKADEKKYPFYKEAMAWLKKNSVAWRWD